MTGQRIRKRNSDDTSGEPAPVPAGGFSKWLRRSEASLRSGKGGVEVPCGGCRGCCRSSMFIHIKPEEKQTIERIPRGLLFDAPGLPNGHVLMGYDEKGQCPMLVDNECSIYEYRPQTCRDYDCRIFTATGIPVDLKAQAEIANRVRAWTFDYEGKESRAEHRAVMRAAAFLQENRDLFPTGSIPSYPVQLAALAITVFRLFSRKKPDAVIAQAILKAMR